MSIDEIDFGDAVFSIPKNSVSVRFKIQVYERGEIHTVEGAFDPEDIRAAFNLFEQTVRGEYPTFVLTEKGAEYAKYLDDIRTGAVGEGGAE